MEPRVSKYIVLDVMNFTIVTLRELVMARHRCTTQTSIGDTHRLSWCIHCVPKYTDYRGVIVKKNQEKKNVYVIHVLSIYSNLYL